MIRFRIRSLDFHLVPPGTIERPGAFETVLFQADQLIKMRPPVVKSFLPHCPVQIQR